MIAHANASSVDHMLYSLSRVMLHRQCAFEPWSHCSPPPAARTDATPSSKANMIPIEQVGRELRMRSSKPAGGNGHTAASFDRVVSFESYCALDEAARRQCEATRKICRMKPNCGPPAEARIVSLRLSTFAQLGFLWHMDQSDSTAAAIIRSAHRFLFRRRPWVARLAECVLNSAGVRPHGFIAVHLRHSPEKLAEARKVGKRLPEPGEYARLTEAVRRVSGLHGTVMAQSASAVLLQAFRDNSSSQLRIGFTANARHEHDHWGGWGEACFAGSSSRGGDGGEGGGDDGGGARGHDSGSDAQPDDSLAVAAVNAQIAASSALLISPSQSTWTSFLGHLMHSARGIDVRSFDCGPAAVLSGGVRRSAGGYLRIVQSAAVMIKGADSNDGASSAAASAMATSKDETGGAETVVTAGWEALRAAVHPRGCFPTWRTAPINVTTRRYSPTVPAGSTNPSPDTFSLLPPVLSAGRRPAAYVAGSVEQAWMGTRSTSVLNASAGRGGNCAILCAVAGRADMKLALNFSGQTHGVSPSPLQPNADVSSALSHLHWSDGYDEWIEPLTGAARHPHASHSGCWLRRCARGVREVGEYDLSYLVLTNAVRAAL